MRRIHAPIPHPLSRLLPRRVAWLTPPEGTPIWQHARARAGDQAWSSPLPSSTRCLVTKISLPLDTAQPV
ncbi:MAG: hypothetical protein AMXMBFR61_12360 [Fimbriimonadales bacterium]